MGYQVRGKPANVSLINFLWSNYYHAEDKENPRWPCDPLSVALFGLIEVETMPETLVT